MKFLILLTLVGLTMAGARSPLLPKPLTRHSMETKVGGARNPMLPNPLARHSIETKVGGARNPMLPNPLARHSVETKVGGARNPMLPNPLARHSMETKVRVARSPLLPKPLSRQSVETKVGGARNSLLPKPLSRHSMETKMAKARNPLLPRPLARHSMESKAGTGYIVGGVAAASGQIPYIVSLQRTSHFCGGTIISADWILTAAHCVESVAASSLNVRYNSLEHNNGGLLVKVSNVYTHENYDSWTIDNDVAVLKLATPLTLDQVNAAAVALPSQGSDVAAGDVTVSGWGYLLEGGGVLPPQLQTLDVASVDRATCNTAYDGEITENMFCAGVLNVGGQDACQGDSGGPVVQNGQVIGAVSWGYGCARPQYPGVYTRIGVFVDWIKGKQAL